MNLKPTVSGWRDWLLVAMCMAWLLALAWIGDTAHPFLASIQIADVTAVIGVVVTAGAIYFTGRHGVKLQDRQRRLAAAESVTAVFVLARAAGREVINLDRYARKAGVSNAQREDDVERLGGIRRKWAHWIPNRWDGLSDAIKAYKPSGAESGAFIDDLITVSTRIVWLRNVGGKQLASGDLTVPEAAMLTEAAHSTIIALVAMREEVDRLRRDARMPPLESLKLPESIMPEMKAKRRDAWAKVPSL